MAKFDMPVFMRLGDGPEVQIGVVVGDSFVSQTSAEVAANSRFRNTEELTRRANELSTGEMVKARFADDVHGVIELFGKVYADGDYLMVGGWIIGRYGADEHVTISSLLTYLRKQV